VAPPYTWEEEMDFYRRVNAGPMTMYYGSRRSDGKPAPTEEQAPVKKRRPLQSSRKMISRH
jgi:hypothetical protein